MKNTVENIVDILNKGCAICPDYFKSLNIYNPDTMKYYLNIALMSIPDHTRHNIIISKKIIDDLIEDVERRNNESKRMLEGHHLNIVSSNDEDMALKLFAIFEEENAMIEKDAAYARSLHEQLNC
jgi:hypothetical protein